MPQVIPAVVGTLAAPLVVLLGEGAAIAVSTWVVTAAGNAAIPACRSRLLLPLVAR